jgi:hypothetical protein
MANIDAPRGLRPLNGNGGSSPRLRKYKAGTTTNIGRGDVVAIASNGRAHRVATTTGSDLIVGVAATYVATPASGVTTPPDVWVYDDPDQLFVIQDDGAGATPAQASLGATYPLVLGSPNTTTGQSIQELDISAPGAAATDPLLAVDFLTGPAMEIGANANMIVRLNRHLYKTGATGVN